MCGFEMFMGLPGRAVTGLFDRRGWVIVGIVLLLSGEDMDDNRQKALFLIDPDSINNNR